MQTENAQVETDKSPQLVLTDKQLRICNAVVAAATSIEKKYDIDLFSKDLFGFTPMLTLHLPAASGHSSICSRWHSAKSMMEYAM